MEEDLSVIEDSYDEEQDRLAAIEHDYLSQKALSNIKRDRVYYQYDKKGKIVARSIVVEFNNGAVIELNIKVNDVESGV